METQEGINYQRIAEAIQYIQANFKDQPSLNEVAEKVHLSPFHFQKLFVDWAGTTPKKFLQYVSTEYAKTMLAENRYSLADAAFETGLSSTSRLHDLFVKIEGMTPAEYRNGGLDLHINYSFADTLFGKVLIAATAKGVCYLAFDDGEGAAIERLFSKFANAAFTNQMDGHQQNALSIFQYDTSQLPTIKLHLKGTAFQLKVWEALLKIPIGKLCTYGTIGNQLQMPGASRAIGTAIGSNPVGFLIPCHRVIQATGAIGGYMWGATRKAAIIGWEGAKTDITN